MRFTKKEELRRLQQQRLKYGNDSTPYRQSSNLGRFFVGLIMMTAGGFLFLDAIEVVHQFNWASALFRIGQFNLTPGLVLVPFLFGVGMIFYNPDNDLGVILIVISLVMLTAGVLFNIQFKLRSMSSFELMMILGLAVGGVGLFLSALRRM